MPLMPLPNNMLCALHATTLASKRRTSSLSSKYGGCVAAVRNFAMLATLMVTQILLLADPGCRIILCSVSVCSCQCAVRDRPTSANA